MHVSTDTNPGDVTTKLLSPNACVSCEMGGRVQTFFNWKILICHVRIFLRSGDVCEEQKVETVVCR